MPNERIQMPTEIGMVLDEEWKRFIDVLEGVEGVWIKENESSGKSSGVSKLLYWVVGCITISSSEVCTSGDEVGYLKW